MAKNNNYSLTDIATLKADMRWIKDKLDEMSGTLNNIKLCTDGHDSKIAKLEGWCSTHDKVESNKKEERNMSLKREGLLISALGIIIGVVFFALNWAFGR